MKNKAKIIRILRRVLAPVLAIVLIVGCSFWVMGFKQIEPENPVNSHKTELTAESVSEGTIQALKGEGGEEQSEEKEEQEKEKQEKEESEKEQEKEEPDDRETEKLPDLPRTPLDKMDLDSANGSAEDPDNPDASGLPGGENPGGGELYNPGDGEGGNEGTTPDNPQPGPLDDSEMRLVTSLTNCVLTYRQLEEDMLPFEAYIVNGESDMYLRVKIQNGETAKNGDYLTADGRNYTAKLAREEHNRITIYIRQGSTTIASYTYVVYYIADKADENNQEVGDHPPVITTNLDSWTGEMTNRHFTFLVGAKTYQGKTIYESSILVQMDGKKITYPTGSGVYEYELTFPQPEEGDRAEHKITVLAWDDEGNSAYRSFKIIYRNTASGGVIGTCYVLIDMTTIGLGVTENYACSIRQDQPASYAVLEMLKNNGYSCDYGGSPDSGFYLRRIRRGGMAKNAKVPDNLWKKIGDDGLVKTGQRYSDSVGEFDYTQGSGWMYSINGSLYAGKSLSSYFLSDGDTIYLRYTLAYGKDIGGSGSGFGTLKSYCGKWIGGTYIDQHQWKAEEVVKEPTCIEEGESASVCAVCGDRKTSKSIPPLGHNYKQTGRQEPSGGENGWIEYTCSRCGDIYKDPLIQCAGGHNWTEKTVRKATCTEAGERQIVCQVCGEVQKTETIPASGHDYQEAGRQNPTETEAGSVTYTCSRCGNNYTEKLPATGPAGGGGTNEIMLSLFRIIRGMSG